MRKRHLSKNLKEFLEREVNKLGLKGKVTGITTDGGADIKKATSSNNLFGARFGCVAHKINRILQVGLNLWKKPRCVTFS